MKTSGYFESGDGVRIYFRQRIPDGDVRAVVFGVHGFAEHGRRYDHVEEFFVERGCAFLMMDNRSHGYSEGKRGHIDKYGDFVDDLHRFIKSQADLTKGRKVFVLGHSNGSLISIRYAFQYQSELAGMILSGALIRASVPVPAIKLAMMPLMGRLFPKLMFAAGIDPKGVSTDPEVVRAYTDDPLVYRVISARFAHEMFLAMADSLARAGEIRLPILMMHGEKDPMCDPAAAKEFFDKLSSADKTFIAYPGMLHEIFNEIEKEKVFADIDGWLKKHL